MSLTGALNNAFSGLSSNSRAAALVSSNISNATTEGYGQRELDLGADIVGGVRVNGVVRNTDPALTSDRRQSDAQLGYSSELLTFANRIDRFLGDSGDAGSFVGRVDAFENALLVAASNPASGQRLETVAHAATDLAATLNGISTEVQKARTDADKAIGQQVDQINESLQRLDQINDDVVKGRITGLDTSSMEDERARLIDNIAEIVPLRIVEKDSGAFTIYTTGGAVLLDSSAAEIEFEPTIIVRAGDTMAGGDLSGLTLNGSAINSSETGMFRGGTLAAQFEIRDGVGVERQAELDAIARDLVERLGPGGPDATIGATDPGLFTDAGLAFDALNEVGLAGRISLNSLVEPGGGGAWRLRDGLGATTQGDAGDARLLQGISEALATQVLPGSGSLSPVARSFVTQVSEFASEVSGYRVGRENAQLYLGTRNTALKELELSKGVDSDSELQHLMQIEQLYAANAKVMSTVDQLFERLLSI